MPLSVSYNGIYWKEGVGQLLKIKYLYNILCM